MADTGMRFLIETWLLLSDQLEVAEHTTSFCTLPTNRLLVAFNSEPSIPNIAQACSMASIPPRCQPVTSTRHLCRHAECHGKRWSTCGLVTGGSFTSTTTGASRSCKLSASAVIDAHKVPELAITSSEFGSAHSTPDLSAKPQWPAQTRFRSIKSLMRHMAKVTLTHRR